MAACWRSSMPASSNPFSGATLRNTQVIEVLGDDKVTGLTVRDTVSGEERELAVTGVFVAIGHIPNTTLVIGQVDLEENRYGRTGLGSFTNIDGLRSAEHT